MDTKIQKQIEVIVTNLGYDSRNLVIMPDRLRNNEIGVQIALANMDIFDGKFDSLHSVDVIPRIETFIKKFDRAGIPLEVITDAEGFRRAYNSAYEPILNDDRSVTYRRVAELTKLEEFGTYWIVFYEYIKRLYY